VIRIRTSHRYEDPTPPNIFTDHDWIRDHQEALIAQYGECFMIVYHEQILGTGATRAEALANAEGNVLPGADEIEVMVEWVGRRHPFLRARPLRIDPEQAVDEA
jgi:hypothetical protein